MIKLKNFVQKDIKYKSLYTPDVGAFNIDFEGMNDDYLPYQPTENCMIWLGVNGLIGEIEVLACNIIKLTSIMAEDLSIKEDKFFPTLDIIFNRGKYVFVELYEKKFIIWFEDGLDIDKKYVYQDLVFYASKDQIVAIEANNYETIIYESDS